MLKSFEQQIHEPILLFVHFIINKIIQLKSTLIFSKTKIVSKKRNLLRPNLILNFDKNDP